MVKCANCGVTLTECVYRVKGLWWCRPCFRRAYP